MRQFNLGHVDVDTEAGSLSRTSVTTGAPTAERTISLCPSSLFLSPADPFA
jgi:hypothetical protein